MTSSALNHDITVTVLGCGDSAGVPRIGNEWGRCDPNEPRNRRTRPSIAVCSATTTIIVDTGVDFSDQLTREDIKDVTAVLYTHGHSDHVNGIDDLRFIHQRQKERVPIYADLGTYEELLIRFSYIFEQKSPNYPSVAEVRILNESDFGKVHRIGDIPFIPFLQDHGQGSRSLGYRFGDVCYSTDMIDLDDSTIGMMKGTKVWIADCADYGHSGFILHSNIENLERLNAKIGAERVLLTHLRFIHDYKTMIGECPSGYEPAYDGMKIKADGTIL